MLIRHTVCRYFEARGFDVESASNGLEALEMLKSIHPDIIITDIEMPKLDGRQFIKALKSRPETSAIPIVVLSASKSRTEGTEEIRADYIVFKDIDVESQLQQVVKAALPD